MLLNCPITKADIIFIEHILDTNLVSLKKRHEKLHQQTAKWNSGTET